MISIIKYEYFHDMVLFVLQTKKIKTYHDGGGHFGHHNQFQRTQDFRNSDKVGIK